MFQQSGERRHYCWITENRTFSSFCLCAQFTFLLSWSNLEAARYLETLKAYENKPTASIQERVEDDFLPQVTKVMKNIPSVNKTDVLTLLQGFQNIKGIFCNFLYLGNIFYPRDYILTVLRCFVWCMIAIFTRGLRSRWTTAASMSRFVLNKFNLRLISGYCLLLYLTLPLIVHPSQA